MFDTILMMIEITLYIYILIAMLVIFSKSIYYITINNNRGDK